MAWRIKNYARFQHFKDRSPPWIKLYRDLLDDPDWHGLDSGFSKTLVMLWLIASEDETKSGILPDNRKLCFRLRISEAELVQTIAGLSHWLEQVDIDSISGRYHDDAPETEKSKKETEHSPPSSSSVGNDGFASFWNTYPKKIGKGGAEKAWKKLKPDLATVLHAIECARTTDQWCKDNGQFIPHPATWLNQRRWEDDGVVAVANLPNIASDSKPKAGDIRTRHGAEEVFSECAGWVPA